MLVPEFLAIFYDVVFMHCLLLIVLIIDVFFIFYDYMTLMGFLVEILNFVQ